MYEGSNPKSRLELVLVSQLYFVLITPFSGAVLPLTVIFISYGTICPSAMFEGCSEFTEEGKSAPGIGLEAVPPPGVGHANCEGVFLS